MVSAEIFEISVLVSDYDYDIAWHLTEYCEREQGGRTLAPLQSGSINLVSHL